MSMIEEPLVKEPIYMGTKKIAVAKGILNKKSESCDQDDYTNELDIGERTISRELELKTPKIPKMVEFKRRDSENFPYLTNDDIRIKITAEIQK